MRKFNNFDLKICYTLVFIFLFCIYGGISYLNAQETRKHIEKFFKQPNLTVVYGTNNEATVDILVKQANIISDGYKQNRNISIAVKSDAEITQDDFESATLILIGTPSSNLILQKLLPELPLEFNNDGYLWGGKSYKEKDKLLRFIFPNPFNQKKLLAVYTGNDDRELRSRYFDLNLFGLGGEYSITQKTFVIRAGFFNKEGMKWSYADQFDRDNEANLKKFFNTIRLHKTKHYNLYYYPDSPLAPYIKHIGELKEKEYPKHFSLLQQPLEDYKITIYYFKSVKQMTDVGMFGNDPSTLLITFIGASFNDIPGWGTHEDMHPLSYYLLGQISGGGDISSPLLGEGIACLIHGDGVWHGKPLEYWAVKFLAEGRIPSLHNLLDRYRILNWLITYPISGHFVKFLLENYGIQKFKKLWNSQDLKEAFPRILGISLNELERQWHDSIMSLKSRYERKIEAGQFFELGLIYYWDENYAASKEKLVEALEREPSNCEIHYFLARNCFNLGLHKNAERYFRTYLALEKPPMFKWMTPHVYLNLGILSNKRGKKDKATEYYEKVLDLPNERRSYEFAKKGMQGELEITILANAYDLPYAWPFGVHIPAFRPELMGGSVSYFCFALNHLKQGEYQDTLRFLDRALTDNKEDPDIHYFRSVAKFQLGEYQNALKIFNQILDSGRKSYRDYIPTLIHLYKGKIFDVLMKRDKAKSEYNIVLSLPDWKKAHEEASKYLKSPFQHVNGYFL